MAELKPCGDVLGRTFKFWALNALALLEYARFHGYRKEELIEILGELP